MCVCHACVARRHPAHPKAPRQLIRDGQRESERRTRSVFIPFERNGVLVTRDRQAYRRQPNAFIEVKGERVQFGGTIRRVIPKVRGKAARRADKRARMDVRRTLAHPSAPEAPC